MKYNIPQAAHNVDSFRAVRNLAAEVDAEAEEAGLLIGRASVAACERDRVRLRLEAFGLIHNARLKAHRAELALAGLLGLRLRNATEGKVSP